MDYPNIPSVYRVAAVLQERRKETQNSRYLKKKIHPGGGVVYNNTGVWAMDTVWVYLRVSRLY